MKREINVIEEHKVVITTITDDDGKYVGRARCHEGDEFDAELGKKISSLRARIKRSKSLSKVAKREVKEYNKIAEAWGEVADKHDKKVANCEKQLEELFKTID